MSLILASSRGGLPTATANQVVAAPASGPYPAKPVARLLLAADIPSLDASKIGSGTLAIACGGTGSGTRNFVLLTPTSSADNVIQASDNNYVPLVLKQIAFSTANLLEIQQSNGTVLAKVTSAGYGEFTSSIKINGPRPVYLDADYLNGNYGIKMQGQAGGWIHAFSFRGSGGTYRGGFGAYGGDDSLNRFFIGDFYGVEAVTVLAAGATGIGMTAPTSRLHVRESDSGTANTVNALTIDHESSGTPATNFGTAIQITGKSSTTSSRVMARVRALWVDATDASRQADLVLSAYDTAEREGIRIRGDGSAARIGFFGATPVAKATVTGSRAGNAALADLLTKLTNLGLITDGSSA